MKTTAVGPIAAKQTQVIIQATSNGYIVLNRPQYQSGEPMEVLASFESLASLQRWLSKNLVPR